MTEQQPPEGARQPHFGRWMGSMWLYTVLRFALFFVLWGILLLCGVDGLFAAVVALVISVPLSLVLLAKPRAAFTAQLQARVEARQARQAELAHRLDPDETRDPD